MTFPLIFSLHKTLEQAVTFPGSKETFILHAMHAQQGVQREEAINDTCVSDKKQHLSLLKNVSSSTK